MIHRVLDNLPSTTPKIDETTNKVAQTKNRIIKKREKKFSSMSYKGMKN